MLHKLWAQCRPQRMQDPILGSAGRVAGPRKTSINEDGQLVTALMHGEDATCII